MAKQEFAVPRVLARVNHPKNEWLFTEQWGVDAAVSPPHILTAMVEEAVTVGDLVRLIRLEGGRISIVEMTLPDASPSVGRPLYELRLPPDSAVVAILRDGHVVIPQPETVFSPGDEVVALCSPGSESGLRAAVVGEDAPGGTPQGGLSSTSEISSAALPAGRGRGAHNGLDGRGHDADPTTDTESVESLTGRSGDRIDPRHGLDAQAGRRPRSERHSGSTSAPHPAWARPSRCCRRGSAGANAGARS